MFPVPLELRVSRKLDYDYPMNPYDKRSPLLLEYTQGLKPLRVPEKFTIEVGWLYVYFFLVVSCLKFYQLIIIWNHGI